MKQDFEFTNDWHGKFEKVWRQLLQRSRPSRILEIGSYEGRSACFMIEECARDRALELHCIDTWQGGVEHNRASMGDVERRFDRNLEKAISRAAHPVSLCKHKSLSVPALARILAEDGEGSFDWVYVDGSHQAPDVLADAVLSFHLAKVGGLVIFDDYLWSQGKPGHQDPLNMPKPAIDAFVNLYQRKLVVMNAPLYQLYIRKLAR